MFFCIATPENGLTASPIVENTTKLSKFWVAAPAPNPPPSPHAGIPKTR